MRICIIADSNSIHTIRWCNYIADNNHTVHLIDFSEHIFIKKQQNQTKNSYNKQIHIHYIKTINSLLGNKNLKSVKPFLSTANFFLKFIQMNYLVHKIRPEILHGHYLLNWGSWAYRSKFRPLVLSAWGSDLSSVMKGSKQHKIYIKMFQNSDLIHTNDPPGKDYLIEMGCKPEVIYVRDWGVDTKKFTPDNRCSETRKELYGDIDGYVVIMANSFRTTYDVPTFIRAAGHLNQINHDIRFFLIGDGPEKQQLIELATKIGLGDNLKFLGRVPHERMHLYMANADLYVDTLPGSIGGAGVGISAMEAMSSGLPFIAAQRPGIEIAIKPGENGYIFTPGNDAELSELIMNVKNDVANGIHYGNKSREIACNIGDWETNMKLFVIEYMKIINNYHRRNR